MYVPLKSLDELVNSTLASLSNSKIGATKSGSVARLLIASVMKELADYYSDLVVINNQSFLSRAEGNALDLIGDFVHCVRYNEESDSDYRYRISKQPLAEATSNSIAIYLAAMAVDGVKDVIMHEYAMGTGSGAVYIVIDDLDQEAQILGEVESAIARIKGFGSKVNVLTPFIIEIGLEVALIFRAGVQNIDKEYYRTAASGIISTYLNSLRPGQTLSLKYLRAEIQGLSRDIVEIRFIKLTRNGKEVSLENQACRWNERFVQENRDSVVLV
jgi:hypothetical protein